MAALFSDNFKRTDDALGSCWANLKPSHLVMIDPSPHVAPDYRGVIEYVIRGNEARIYLHRKRRQYVGTVTVGR